MNTLLWIVQAGLAFVFLATGLMKLTQPKDKLIARMETLEDLPHAQIRWLGLAEVAGGLGVILPSLTGILPWLSPLAACGLVLVMVGASYAHLQRKEYSKIAFTLGLLLLALLVAVERFWVMPVA